MSRSLPVFLSLFLLLILPVGTRAQEAPSPVVEGTLVGHDGTALPTSHVHVLPYDNDRTRSISVGPDTSFRAVLDTTGVVTLRFTGHNHKMEETTVLARPGDTIGVNVRLGTFSRPDSLDLRVYGTFNDFSTEEGTVPMTPRGDGTYAATVPSPGDSLTYGVLGTHPDGTQIDDLVYAGDGDYRPVVATPRDSTQIVYDPDAVPRSDTEPMVQFRDTTSAGARYAAFVEDMKARQEAFADAMQRAENPKEKKAVSDTFDWAPNRKRLKQALSNKHPTRVKNAYRAAYLDNTVDHDSVVAEKAIATIPPSSPLWSMGFTFRRAIYAVDGFENYKPFVYELLRNTPSEDVKATALMGLLQKADENEESEKQKLLYTWVESEYSDTHQAQFARSRYAPNRAIQAGKPVPSFEVAALHDTTKTFTPSSFEGQYVLLDFWATWCGPCIEELPTLRKADSTYGGDSFTILSLSLDNKRSTVTGFLKDRKMPWKHAFVEGGFESEVANQFEIVGIPKPILVGPDGKIVATSGDLRGEKLLKTLEEHLGSSGDASGSTESN